jgi:RNA polymerase sigma factor (sigma-70 family)
MFLQLKPNFRTGESTRDPSDEDLILMYLESENKEIIGVLFERYTHLVYGICLRYLGDHEKSRDAVMEIFESLFEKLSIHEVSNFKSWLYSVSRNYCLMDLRKSGTIHRLKEHIVSENEEACEVHPEFQTDTELCSGLLTTAVNSLKNEQCVCIRMMYFQDKSYRDISNLTGFTINQVKSHIQNGKRNLKIYLLSRNGFFLL